MNLQVIEFFENPPTLVCVSSDGASKVILSPLSPNEIRRMNRDKRNRLSQYSGRNPLMVLPQRIGSYEISTLNSNILFDLELQFVWKSLTGQELYRIERIWLHLIR